MSTDKQLLVSALNLPELTNTEMLALLKLIPLFREVPIVRPPTATTLLLLVILKNMQSDVKKDGKTEETEGKELRELREWKGLST